MPVETSLLKVTDRRRLANLVQEQLRERPEVRPFPAAVTQLVSACQDPNATAATFEKIIQTDASLAARLLRMANSPLYGISHEVTSIAHAAAVLGIRQLRHLAFALAGAGMFREGGRAAKQRKQLWSHSLGCATTCQLLAKTAVGVEPDEAFLGGIFHDVGKLFLLDVVPDEYAELASVYQGDRLVEEEKSVFGVTHEEIGLKSAHAWSLAESLKAAIGFHHRPEEAPCHNEFAKIVGAGNALARYWGIGSVEGQNVGTASKYIEELGLSEEDVASLAEQARNLHQEAATAMAD